MEHIGAITRDAEVAVQWKIKRFTSLKMDTRYFSPAVCCAGGKWYLCIRRVSPEGGQSGQRIELYLCSYRSVGPLTLDMEYTFSVRDRNRHRHGEERNIKEFGWHDDSLPIPIKLEEERMPDLLPGDTLTVLCQLERIHPTRGAGVSARSNCSYCGELFDAGSISSHQGKCLNKPIQCPECSEVVVLWNWYDHECHGRSAQGQLKEELQQKTGELASVRRELAEKQSELVRLRRVNKFEADRDNAQKLLQTKKAAQLKKELQQKTAELASVRRELAENQSELVRLRHLNQELNLKVTDLEAARDNAQKLLQAKTQLKEKLEEKTAELESKLILLQHLNQGLNLKVIDLENSRDNLQTSLETETSNVGDTEEYDFTQNFNRFLEERRGTDVTFVSETLDGREEIFAHRLVLAMRSPYFADEFYGEQRCKEATVLILKNVDQKLFKDMIRYCYGWEPHLRTIQETCALLDVASQYKVISLVNVCRTFLRNAEIEPGNVFSLLVVSEKTKDKSLKDRCNKLLQDKTKEVMKFYELCDVTPSMVHAILDLPQLSLCSEYELIKWILEWANAKYKEKDSNCENARDYLEKLLQDMNFLALTLEEFVMLCKNNRGFFSPVEFQSISMNIASPGAAEMPDWYDKDCRFRVYAGMKKQDNFVSNTNRNN